MVKERNLLDKNYFSFLLGLVAHNLDGSPRYSTALPHSRK